MATTTVRQLVSLSVLLAALAACSSPSPRGYAYQNLSGDGNLYAHNAGYYLGADPSHLRDRKDGGP